MADVRDLERVVKIAAPYDSSVEAEVLVESLPVWFDLGWQRVEGQDYGLYGDYKVAAAETSPSYDLRTTTAPVLPPAKGDNLKSQQNPQNPPTP